MSMLTPPGMGGKYRIKGDRYPQMRRPRGRRRLVITTIAAAAALGVLGWGSLQLIDTFTGNTAASASAPRGGPSCKDTGGTRPEGGKSGEKPVAYPEPGDITVNVLNATTKSGLAKTTSEELRKRGFTIGKVDNAPAELDKKVEKPGLLIGAPGERTSAGLKVLGTHIKDAETRYDDREGKDIDLVLGKGFDKLLGKKQAARALTALTRPEPSPAPQDCEK